VEGAFQLLEEMQQNGITPVKAHHSLALDTCVAVGRLDLAFSHFLALVERGRPRVSYDAITCVPGLGFLFAPARHRRGTCMTVLCFPGATCFCCFYLSCRYAILVKGCVRTGWLEGALTLLGHGFAANTLRRSTFGDACSTTLAGCIAEQHLRRAAVLVGEMEAYGMPTSSNVFEAVLVLLVNGRSMQAALSLFQTVRVPTWCAPSPSHPRPPPSSHTRSSVRPIAPL